VVRTEDDDGTEDVGYYFLLKGFAVLAGGVGYLFEGFSEEGEGGRFGVAEGRISYRVIAVV
jgi:hypothetical protein